uniref:BZIP family transcription factor n=1 Tax=Solanum tuberosum TaxID=4113 RepID=M1D8R4_SOLTU
MGNGSDPLATSLYVPRNDKLVEIDRNLIIQSVLASKKATTSHGSADKKNRELGLTVCGDLAPSIPGIHPRLYRSPAVGEWVHGSEEKENENETMRQWYLEGVAGPLFSSDTCIEVFEFDASSSAPQSIVLVTNARDISMEESISEEQIGTNGKRENVSRNKSLSSLVVSVLVNGDGDGIMGPNSVSRIFIVVLIDSVKYVTYSCMLPFIGSVHVAEASSKNNVVDTIRSTNIPH